MCSETLSKQTVITGKTEIMNIHFAVRLKIILVSFPMFIAVKTAHMIITQVEIPKFFENCFMLETVLADKISSIFSIVSFEVSSSARVFISSILLNNSSELPLAQATGEINVIIIRITAAILTDKCFCISEHRFNEGETVGEECAFSRKLYS